MTGTNGITSNNIIFNDWKLNVARVASGQLYQYVGIDVNSTTGWLKIRSATDVKNDLGINGKQDTLIGSGTGQNIKTINSTSLMGSGDITVQPTLVSGTNIKTINGTSILGSGNVSTGPTVAATDVSISEVN